MTYSDFQSDLILYMIFNVLNMALNYLQMTSTDLEMTYERQIRGCLIKKFTNVLLHTTKMIDPRVKSQARGQSNR